MCSPEEFQQYEKRTRHERQPLSRIIRARWWTITLRRDSILASGGYEMREGDRKKVKMRLARQRIARWLQAGVSLETLEPSRVTLTAKVRVWKTITATFQCRNENAFGSLIIRPMLQKAKEKSAQILIARKSCWKQQSRQSKPWRITEVMNNNWKQRQARGFSSLRLTTPWLSKR